MRLALLAPLGREDRQEPLALPAGPGGRQEKMVPPAQQARLAHKAQRAQWGPPGHKA